MSLINQVLRDLQRRQVCPPVTELQAQVRPVASWNSRLTTLSLTICILLVVALALSVYLPLDKKTSPAVFAEISDALPPALPLPTAVPEAALVTPSNDLDAVHLAGIRLAGEEQSSRLLLEFSTSLKQSATIQQTARQLIIQLPDQTTPAAELPLLKMENALVRQVSLLQVNQLWQLTVSFYNEVRVEMLKLEADALYGERLAFDIFPLLSTPKKQVSQVSAPIIPEVKKQTVAKTKGKEKVTKKARVLTQNEQAERLYQRGLTAVKGHSLQDSLKYYQQTLRLQPKHLQARKNLILALIPGNRGLADGLFAEGLILHEPLSLRKWYARALLPVVGAKQAAAVMTDKKGIRSPDAEYRALQAGLWQQAGDYERSLQGYRELLQDFPENGLYLFGLAVAHDQLANENNALEAYQRALKSDIASDLRSYSLQRIKILNKTGGAVP